MGEQNPRTEIMVRVIRPDGPNFRSDLTEFRVFRTLRELLEYLMEKPRCFMRLPNGDWKAILWPSKAYLEPEISGEALDEIWNTARHNPHAKV